MVKIKKQQRERRERKESPKRRWIHTIGLVCYVTAYIKSFSAHTDSRKHEPLLLGFTPTCSKLHIYEAISVMETGLKRILSIKRVLRNHITHSFHLWLSPFRSSASSLHPSPIKSPIPD